MLVFERGVLEPLSYKMVGPNFVFTPFQNVDKPVLFKNFEAARYKVGAVPLYSHTAYSVIPALYVKVLPAAKTPTLDVGEIDQPLNV